MIIRVVKMTFKSSNIDMFLSLFEGVKYKISAFEGCESLELIQDKNNNNIFFTISKWKEDINLENYRNSDLFKSTWKKTKILFDDRPEAWSTESVFKS